MNVAKANGALYLSGPRAEVEAFCNGAGIPRKLLHPLRPGPEGEKRAYARLYGRYKRAAKTRLYGAA